MRPRGPAGVGSHLGSWVPPSRFLCLSRCVLGRRPWPHLSLPKGPVLNRPQVGLGRKGPNPPGRAVSKLPLLGQTYPILHSGSEVFLSCDPDFWPLLEEKEMRVSHPNMTCVLPNSTTHQSCSFLPDPGCTVTSHASAPQNAPCPGILLGDSSLNEPPCLTSNIPDGPAPSGPRGLPTLASLASFLLTSSAHSSRLLGS